MSHVLNCRVLEYGEEHYVELPKHDLGEDNPIYVGFEIEYIDSEAIVVRGKEWPLVYENKVPQRIFDRLNQQNLLDYAKSTLDSSVSGELVTAPLSVEYLMSEPGRDLLRTFENILRDSGAVTDEANHLRWKHRGKSEKCNVGGHIHVSCTDMNTISQVARFIGLTWPYWQSISGRTDLSPWAVFPRVGKDGEVRIDHHSAIHLDRETIEFRFWGATGFAHTLLSRALLCADVVKYASGLQKMTRESTGYADSMLMGLLCKRKIF